MELLVADRRSYESITTDANKKSQLLVLTISRMTQGEPRCRFNSLLSLCLIFVRLSGGAAAAATTAVKPPPAAAAAAAAPTKKIVGGKRTTATDDEAAFNADLAKATAMSLDASNQKHRKFMEDQASQHGQNIAWKLISARLCRSTHAGLRFASFCCCIVSEQMQELSGGAAAAAAAATPAGKSKSSSESTAHNKRARERLSDFTFSAHVCSLDSLFLSCV